MFPLIDWIAADSSCVDSFGWDEDDYVLYVRFHTGKTMAYGVSPAIWIGMLNASSKGAFTYHVLRGHEIGYV